MRYKTPKNLARAIELIVDKGYDQETANHLFHITRRHNQSVEEMIRVLEPKEIKK